MKAEAMTEPSKSLKTKLTMITECMECGLVAAQELNPMNNFH